MSFYDGKSILVTGAGGTIGSELCRQLLKFNPGKLLMLDNSELALYNISRELGGPNVKAILDDIASGSRSRAWDYLPDIVFHAAAYKHVTICEENQDAAMRVNVWGTRCLVDAALAYHTPRLILVSTDKAVRPISVMGRTKEMAEQIVRRAGYSVVRLGNVFGSSGSVVPLWKEQIAKGEPVTITDVNATRYFIDVEYAAQMILALAMRQPGVHTVPMGKPRSIVDVAIALGATRFNVIGLRPGEKLHEELQ